MSEPTTFIYVLKDPRDGAIRYVGKAGNLEERLAYHIEQRYHRTYKAHWVRELVDLGLKPEIMMIARVPLDEWQKWERYYIKKYREFCNLTNGTDGGEGWSEGMPQPEGTGAKVSATLRASDNVAAQKKRIAQYSREGKLVKVWPSAPDAARELKLHRRLLCKCANGERRISGGYIWEYVEGDVVVQQLSQEELDRRFKKKKVSQETRNRMRVAAFKQTVLQYTKSGKFVRQWESIAEAGRLSGVRRSNITQAVLGKSKSAGGFVWKYAEEAGREKPVAQYTLTGGFLRTWPSAMVAIKGTGIYWQALYACVQGRNKLAGGFIWIYVDSADFEGELPPEHAFRLAPPARAKIVNQLTLGGKLIRTWPSAQKAAEAVGLEAGTVAAAARGTSYSAAGYRWSYADN